MTAIPLPPLPAPLARTGALDADAFQGLYREQASRVFSLCLRLTGDRVRAEELAQDVFVRVWEKRWLVPRDGDLTGWLTRVTMRVALNAFRGDRRRLERVEPVEEPSAVERISLRTPAAIRRMDLATATARLPAKARAVYVLHEIEGFSHTEIAAQLGVAPGTVRAQLHRARQLMREALSR